MKGYHPWSSEDASYLNENYGMLPIDELCSTLDRTRVQVYSKAGKLDVTKRSKCKICGRNFIGSGNKKEFFCSQDCRRIHRTARHRRYVSENRAHIREYARTRKRKIWGVSSPEIASKAEKFAMEKVLPGLGFSELYHASAIKRYVPFDIVATFKGQRVLVDVTTGVKKGIAENSQQSFAEALRMPIYVLFIKPDFARYQLTLCNGSRSVAMHLSELTTIE
jgi:hypothetical protein